MKYCAKCFIAIITFASASAFADDMSDCQKAKGAYLTGVVNSSPVFVHGHDKNFNGHRIELSHTHLTFKESNSGATYDVAIDNVFAPGYDQSPHSVPSPLNTIRIGDTVNLCGIIYSGGGKKGIHWVHNNCSEVASSNKPNGFLNVVNAKGVKSKNLESSEEYCGIWPQH